MRLNKLTSLAVCGILVAASLAWADDELELAAALIEGPAPRLNDPKTP